MTSIEGRVLAEFGRVSPARLLHVAVMLNPPPAISRRERWFGGPALDRWQERNDDLRDIAAYLAGAGLIRRTRRRWLDLNNEYEITDTGRVANLERGEAELAEIQSTLLDHVAELYSTDVDPYLAELARRFVAAVGDSAPAEIRAAVGASAERHGGQDHA